MAVYTSQYPPAQTSTYVKSTTKYSTYYWPFYATDPTKTLTGNSSGNAWISGGVFGDIQGKVSIDLGAPYPISRIYLENYHSTGGTTNIGLKDFEIYGALDDAEGAAAFADVTFSGVAGLTLLGLFTATQHPALNVVDPQYFIITNPGLYRYYIMRTLTNYGATYLVGFRRVELQIMDLEGHCVAPMHTVAGEMYGGSNVSEAHTVAAYTAAIGGTISAPIHSVSAVGHLADNIATMTAPAHTIDIEFNPNTATVGPFLGNCVQEAQSVAATTAHVVSLTPEAQSVTATAVVGVMASASMMSRWHSATVVAGAKVEAATVSHSVSGAASQVFLATGVITSRIHSVSAESHHGAIVTGAVTHPLMKVQGTSGQLPICSASLVPHFHQVSGVLSRNHYADGDCIPLLFCFVEGTGRGDSGLSGDVESGAHTLSGTVIDPRYFPILTNNRVCYTSVIGSATNEMHEVLGELRDSALGSMTSEMHEVEGVA